MLAFLFNIFQGAQQQVATGAGDTLAYSDFMAEAAAGRISDVTIKGQTIEGHFSANGQEFTTLVPANENVVERLNNTGVRITAEREDPEQISALIREHFNLTRERIRQIEARAVSKLRHPSSDTGARDLLAV